MHESCLKYVCRRYLCLNISDGGAKISFLIGAGRQLFRKIDPFGLGQSEEPVRADLENVEALEAFLNKIAPGALIWRHTIWRHTIWRHTIWRHTIWRHTRRRAAAGLAAVHPSRAAPRQNRHVHDTGGLRHRALDPFCTI